MERVERALTKQGQNNVLLIGEPGSGRKAVVEALCQKAFQGEMFKVPYVGEIAEKQLAKMK